MQEFLQMLSPTDILFHIINTVILFVALRFLLYKPVRKFMNARTERVQAELDEAAQRQLEARQAVEGIAGQQAQAREQIAKMQAEGAQKAHETADDMLAAARAQAQEIVKTAQEEARLSQEVAQSAAQDQAVQMAMGIASNILGRQIKDKDNQELVEEFLTKVG